MPEPAADPEADSRPAPGPDPAIRRLFRTPNLPDLNLPVSVPLLALIVGTGLSLLAMLQSERLLYREEAHRFSARVEEIHGQLADRIRVYEQVARSAASLVMTFPDLHWTAWNRFVEALDMPQRYPGIISIAYARAIAADRAGDLVASMRAAGLSTFRIWPENAGAERVVNIFTAPVNEANVRAIGFDMMSEVNRRSTIERARDSGEPAATRAITLKIDEATGARPAFILYQATYRGDPLPPSLEARRASFTGVVLTPVRIGPLVDGLIDGRRPDNRPGSQPDTGIEIYDVPPAEAEFPLYRSHRPLKASSALSLSRELPVGGRIWTVRYDSLPNGLITAHDWVPGALLAGGIALSIALSLVLRMVLATHSRAVELAGEMTASLRLQEAERQQLFTQAPLGIALVGTDGLVMDCNPAFAAAAGLPRQELLGTDLRLRSGDQASVSALEAALQGESGKLESDQPLLLGGRRSHFSLHFQPVTAEGALKFVLAFAEDIGEKRRAEQHIQYLAHFDALTGLPNRVLLYDRIAQALREGRRDGTKVAVLFIDLDRFKVINDSLGHSFGDEVLRSVARRLQSGLRESDTVGRLGGDEFLIVVRRVTEPNDAACVAEKVVAHLASPFAVGGQNFVVTPSIGISLYPDDADDPEGLIRCADIAMYHAKEQGRNGFRFVTKEMGAKSRERMDLEGALRRAIREGELFLVYQPQVDTLTGRIVGLEALVRWNHPEEGLILPGRFLPVAEETGLVQAMGDWVLFEACAQIRRWRARFDLSIPVAVNVSGAQFRDGQLPAKVARALDANGLSGPELEIEVTESTLIDDVEAAAETLTALKRRGVLIALDDFGTGYSSLSYLHRLPIDKLKIDRSFIHDLSTGASDASVPRAIVGLGRSLGLSVIAEGVETQEQLQLLRDLACESYQGFLFSRPVPAEEVERLLEKLTAAHPVSAE
ncbi:diguanylate cyclase (GGDEF)-like protein/PAS domain S-box-containing protein [Azospirillum lipoferum]|uniref:EAL domain-containing protein n=1 Tax=Azospirillum lipoferum TaxID=193 RepID=A0A5A9GN23_AZOLI|nr:MULTISPECIES: EAL domain-containing protein [Azospirillum]KAA0595777.1 EAL domain-containing protein [Azospirillum lipoferum]MCP1611350.1 diguanylate cyclase (GGDEF)-like protein/PAS domain S-box-containing protein [Azospirillum lipoferum]MDW5537154.1 EAL domain-containing protein [Azospirillum sp. NL1]